MSEPPLANPKVTCLFVLILAACTPTKSQPLTPIDPVLPSTPCPAPCFFGIQPGSTTLDEAENLLSSAGLCSRPTYSDSTAGGTDAVICETGVFVSSDLGQEIVRLVAFVPFEPLSVGAVVDQLGDPDAVRVSTTMPGEGQRSYMELLYRTALTRLLLPGQEGSVYRLEQDTPVERIVYNEGLFFEEVREDSGPWAGFGEYAQP